MVTAQEALRIILQAIDDMRAQGETDLRSLRGYVSGLSSMIDSGATLEAVLAEYCRDSD